MKVEKGLKETYTKSDSSNSETINEIIFNGLLATIDGCRLNYLLFLLIFLIDNLQIFIMILDFYSNNEPLVEGLQYLRYINLVQLINQDNMSSSVFFALVIFLIIFNIVFLSLLFVLGVFKTNEVNSNMTKILALALNIRFTLYITMMVPIETSISISGLFCSEGEFSTLQNFSNIMCFSTDHFIIILCSFINIALTLFQSSFFSLYYNDFSFFSSKLPWSSPFNYVILLYNKLKIYLVICTLIFKDRWIYQKNVGLLVFYLLLIYYRNKCPLYFHPGSLGLKVSVEGFLMSFSFFSFFYFEILYHTDITSSLSIIFIILLSISCGILYFKIVIRLSDIRFVSLKFKRDITEDNNHQISDYDLYIHLNKFIYYLYYYMEEGKYSQMLLAFFLNHIQICDNDNCVCEKIYYILNNKSGVFSTFDKKEIIFLNNEVLPVGFKSDIDLSLLKANYDNTLYNNERNTNINNNNDIDMKLNHITPNQTAKYNKNNNILNFSKINNSSILDLKDKDKDESEEVDVLKDQVSINNSSISSSNSNKDIKKVDRLKNSFNMIKNSFKRLFKNRFGQEKMLKNLTENFQKNSKEEFFKHNHFKLWGTLISDIYNFESNGFKDTDLFFKNELANVAMYLILNINYALYEVCLTSLKKKTYIQEYLLHLTKTNVMSRILDINENQNKYYLSKKTLLFNYNLENFYYELEIAINLNKQFWSEMLRKDISAKKIELIGQKIAEKSIKIEKLANKILEDNANDLGFLKLYGCFLSKVWRIEEDSKRFLSKAYNIISNELYDKSDKKHLEYLESNKLAILIVSGNQVDIGTIVYSNITFFHYVNKTSIMGLEEKRVTKAVRISQESVKNSHRNMITAKNALSNSMMNISNKNNKDPFVNYANNNSTDFKNKIMSTTNNNLNNSAQIKSKREKRKYIDINNKLNSSSFQSVNKLLNFYDLEIQESSESKDHSSIDSESFNKKKNLISSSGFYEGGEMQKNERYNHNHTITDYCSFFVGKNLGEFLPDNIATNHKSYMINYYHNSKGTYLNQTRKVFLLDNKRYLLPMKLNVKLLPYLKDGNYFIGYFNPTLSYHTKAQAPQGYQFSYIMTNDKGNILFTDKLAHEEFKLSKKHFLNTLNREQENFFINSIFPEIKKKEIIPEMMHSLIKLHYDSKGLSKLGLSWLRFSDILKKVAQNKFLFNNNKLVNKYNISKDDKINRRNHRLTNALLPIRNKSGSKNTVNNSFSERNRVPISYQNTTNIYNFIENKDFNGKDNHNQNDNIITEENNKTIANEFILNNSIHNSNSKDKRRANNLIINSKDSKTSIIRNNNKKRPTTNLTLNFNYINQDDINNSLEEEVKDVRPVYPVTQINETFEKLFFIVYQIAVKTDADSALFEVLKDNIDYGIEDDHYNDQGSVASSVSTIGTSSLNRSNIKMSISKIKNSSLERSTPKNVKLLLYCFILFLVLNILIMIIETIVLQQKNSDINTCFELTYYLFKSKYYIKNLNLLFITNILNYIKSDVVFKNIDYSSLINPETGNVNITEYKKLSKQRKSFTLELESILSTDDNYDNFFKKLKEDFNMTDAQAYAKLDSLFPNRNVNQGYYSKARNFFISMISFNSGYLIPKAEAIESNNYFSDSFDVASNDVLILNSNNLYTNILYDSYFKSSLLNKIDMLNNYTNSVVSIFDSSKNDILNVMFDRSVYIYNYFNRDKYSTSVYSLPSAIQVWILTLKNIINRDLAYIEDITLNGNKEFANLSSLAINRQNEIQDYLTIINSGKDSLILYLDSALEKSLNEIYHILDKQNNLIFITFIIGILICCIFLIIYSLAFYKYNELRFSVFYVLIEINPEICVYCLEETEILERNINSIFRDDLVFFQQNLEQIEELKALLIKKIELANWKDKFIKTASKKEKQLLLYDKYYNTKSIIDLLFDTKLLPKIDLSAYLDFVPSAYRYSLYNQNIKMNPKALNKNYSIEGNNNYKINSNSNKNNNDKRDIQFAKRGAKNFTSKKLSDYSHLRQLKTLKSNVSGSEMNENNNHNSSTGSKKGLTSSFYNTNKFKFSSKDVSNFQTFKEDDLNDDIILRKKKNANTNSNANELVSLNSNENQTTNSNFISVKSESMLSENKNLTSSMNDNHFNRLIKPKKRESSFLRDKRDKTKNFNSININSELEPIYENTENLFDIRKEQEYNDSLHNISNNKNDKSAYEYNSDFSYLEPEKRDNWESKDLKVTDVPEEKFKISSINSLIKTKNSNKDLTNTVDNRKDDKINSKRFSLFNAFKKSVSIKKNTDNLSIKKEKLNTQFSFAPNENTSYSKKTFKKRNILYEDNKSVLSMASSTTNAPLMSQKETKVLNTNASINKTTTQNHNNNTANQKSENTEKVDSTNKASFFINKAENLVKDHKIRQVNKYKKKFIFNFKIMCYSFFFIILFSMFYFISKNLADDSKSTLEFYFILNTFYSRVLNFADLSRDFVINEGFNKYRSDDSQRINNIHTIFYYFRNVTMDLENINNFFRENPNQISSIIDYMAFLNNKSFCNEYSILNSYMVDSNEYISKYNPNITTKYNPDLLYHTQFFNKKIFTEEISQYDLFDDKSSLIGDNYYKYFNDKVNSILSSISSSLPRNYNNYNTSHLNLTKYASYYAFCNYSFYLEGFSQGMIKSFDELNNINDNISDLELNSLEEKLKFLTSIELDNYLLIVNEIFIPIANNIFIEFSETNAKSSISSLFRNSKIKLSILMVICLFLFILYYKANIKFTQKLVFNRAIMLLIPSSAYKKKEKFFGLFMESLD